MLGKGVSTTVSFPLGTDLKHALMGVNYGHHINHSLDDKPMFDPSTQELIKGIGAYQFVSYDEEARRAIMKCTNTYPSKFDEGVIVQVLRMQKAKDSMKQNV